MYYIYTIEYHIANATYILKESLESMRKYFRMAGEKRLYILLLLNFGCETGAKRGRKGNKGEEEEGKVGGRKGWSEGEKIKD